MTDICDLVSREDKMNLEDVGMKVAWCNELLKAIDEIKESKYPNVDVWIDTGSKLNEALAVLQRVKEDLKCQ